MAWLVLVFLITLSLTKPIVSYMIYMIKTLQENIPLIESLFLASKMYFCIIKKKKKKKKKELRITFIYLLIFQEHLLD